MDLEDFKIQADRKGWIYIGESDVMASWGGQPYYGIRNYTWITPLGKEIVMRKGPRGTGLTIVNADTDN